MKRWQKNAENSGRPEDAVDYEGEVSAAVICQGLAVEHQRESETRGRILDPLNRRFYEVEKGRDGNGMALEVYILPRLSLDRCP